MKTSGYANEKPNENVYENVYENENVYVYVYCFIIFRRSSLRSHTAEDA